MLSITSILRMTQPTREYELRRSVGRLRRATAMADKRSAIADYWALRRYVVNDSFDLIVRRSEHTTVEVVAAGICEVERWNQRPLQRLALA